MNQKKEALIIIVSAPSGSGKTTVVGKLLGELTGIKRSISYTTRAPREGESAGDDYVFISKEDFMKKAEAGDFAEWEETFDNFYGTPKAQFTEAVEKGEDIILSIDVKGARTIKKSFPESVSIFIMPPSEEELVARLRNRKTDKESQVALRLKESAKEIEAADEYDYLIVNDDLGKSVEELKSIIETERTNRKKGDKK